MAKTEQIDMGPKLDAIHTVLRDIRDEVREMGTILVDVRDSLRASEEEDEEDPEAGGGKP